jgi:hypothetical protein
MSRSYPLLTLASAVLGALLVITTFAFGGAAEAWIAFGLSVVALGASLGTVRANAAHAIGAGVVSAWTVLVALGIFSGATQTWLIFAGGVVIGVSGVVGNALAERRPTRGLVAVPGTKAA